MTTTINGSTGVVSPGTYKFTTTSGGSINVTPTDTASAVTVTIPAATDTVTLNTEMQTLTNKTLTAAGVNTVEATSGPTSTQLAGQRNKIINGAMMIDQRNAGASVTPTAGAYTLDRWNFELSQSSKLTTQQNAGSVTPPVGFKNYLGITSSSSYSSGASDYFDVNQRIEGFNCSDLAWGTANAKTVTLSFQVYSSLTGTFSGALQNSGATRAYPFSYTVSSANTWTSISVVIPGDTSGTWLTTNGTGIQLCFDLGSGSTLRTTAGAWAAGWYIGVTGAVSVVGTSGATWYVTGVQLEKGATATPFENRLYGTELALCQRYGNRYQGSGAGYGRIGVGTWASNGTLGYVQVFLPVTMRAVPTLSVANAGSLLVEGVAWYTCSSMSITESSPKLVVLQCNLSSSIGTATGWATVVGQAVDIFLSAEL